MAILMIGYDLNKEGPNYNKRRDAVIEVLKNISGTYWHSLDSTWLVQTNRDAMSVAQDIWKVMDQNDELLVAPLDLPRAAWAGFDPEYSEWLKSHS